MLSFGSDDDTLPQLAAQRPRTHAQDARAARHQARTSPEPSRLIDVLVAVLPPAAAVLTTITNVVNLWLAERIVTVSGRLRRPLPDLAAMQFPVYAPGAARRRGRRLVSVRHHRHLAGVLAAAC